MIRFKPFELWLFWVTVIYVESAVTLLSFFGLHSTWLNVAQLVWVVIVSLPLLVRPLGDWLFE